MGFRAFLVMDNTVARQVIAENGRKWQKIEVRLKKTTFAKNGRKWISACFTSWSSRWPGRQCRKWPKMAKKDFRGYMVGNGFPRVSRRGHRGDQAGNGRKWSKMVEKSSPRLFGRKWISAYFTSFPYYSRTHHPIILHKALIKVRMTPKSLIIRLIGWGFTIRRIELSLNRSFDAQVLHRW